MTQERADVLAIGALDPADGVIVEALLKVSKAPLGWDGEFCARYFMRYSSLESLPMGIVMCLEPLSSTAAWREHCGTGTPVILSAGVSPEEAKEAQAAGAVLLRHVSISTPALEGVVKYSSSDELLATLRGLLKQTAGQA